MAKVEIYVSTDVEADGPIPGPNSMLSFGSAAFRANGELVETFSANLETLDGAQGDPKTMAWWESQPEAWAACRKETRDPAEAMSAYVEWLEALPGKPVFVGYPATYDFMFVYWYLMRFVGRSPFSHSGLDIKTLLLPGQRRRALHHGHCYLRRRWSGYLGSSRRGCGAAAPLRGDRSRPGRAGDPFRTRGRRRRSPRPRSRRG